MERSFVGADGVGIVGERRARSATRDVNRSWQNVNVNVNVRIFINFVLQ